MFLWPPDGAAVPPGPAGHEARQFGRVEHSAAGKDGDIHSVGGRGKARLSGENVTKYQPPHVSWCLCKLYTCAAIYYASMYRYCIILSNDVRYLSLYTRRCI